MNPQRTQAILLRSLLWLILALWFGSFVAFPALAVLAFRILPSTEVAGTLVSPVLMALHLYGFVAGLLVAGLGRALGRGRILWLGPLVLSAVCLYSELAVTGEMAKIRDQVFGAQGNLEAATRFNALHQFSMILFTCVALGTGVLVLLHARADALLARPPGPPLEDPRGADPSRTETARERFS
ncbi:hypothetical protein MK489_01495 [Myxococcota bacterium]|nr:hypothetical protein [Myxococcota bacterium]